jgi:NAD(P)-dependent dehydrogenase (short-subunit alcohol dehydrogenase family)
MPLTMTERFSLAGRRAMVTGGAGHLGRVIADALAQLGAAVLLVDRDDAVLAAAAQRLGALHGVDVTAHGCDLEDDAARGALVGTLLDAGRPLDILVNNAAFTGTANLTGWAEPFESQTTDTFRRALEVNLVAVFDLCRGCAPLLRASTRGSIINIGSIYGELGPDWSLYEGTAMANPAAYAASKGGVLQLTRWLATSMAPHVRVNAVSPGGIARGQPASFVTRYEARTPLGRMATEDDMTGAVTFLASDLSAYVTGQVLRVDGGLSAW